MNCRDISSILDDRDIAHLTQAERQDVEAHTEGCVECSREWAVQQRVGERRGLKEVHQSR